MFPRKQASIHYCVRKNKSKSHFAERFWNCMWLLRDKSCGQQLFGPNGELECWFVVFFMLATHKNRYVRVSLIIKHHDDQTLIKRLWDKFECPIDKHSFAPSHGPEQRGFPKAYHLFKFFIVLIRKSCVEMPKKKWIFYFCDYIGLDRLKDVIPISISWWQLKSSFFTGFR